MSKCHRIIRQYNQKIKEFILELLKQASRCNFGGQIHVELRDGLIVEINIRNLEKDLMKVPKYFFQDGRNVCIIYEAMH